jgi:hypothetical protein
MPPRAHDPERGARRLDRSADRRETEAGALAETSTAMERAGDPATARRLVDSARRQRVLAILDRARAAALRAAPWPPWWRGD